MKRLAAVFMLAILCVAIGGCTQRGPVALPWAWYDTDGKKAHDAFGNFVEALKTGDPAVVKAAFSPHVQQLPETDAAIATLMDGIKGEITGWDDKAYMESKERTDGMTTTRVQRSFNIYTTENTYHGECFTWTAHDADKSRVGIDGIYIVPADAWYFRCFQQLYGAEPQAGVFFAADPPYEPKYDEIEWHSIVQRWTDALEIGDFFTLRGMFVKPLREDAAFSRNLRDAVDSLTGQPDGKWAFDSAVMLFDEMEMDGRMYHQLRCHFTFTTAETSYAAYLWANMSDVPDSARRGVWAVYLMPAEEAAADAQSVLERTPEPGIHLALP